MYSKTITTSDVGTTIAMMEEVLNAEEGSTSVVAGINQGLYNNREHHDGISS